MQSKGSQRVSGSVGHVKMPKLIDGKLIYIFSCKNYRIANLFPARVVAIGCLYTVLTERGLKMLGDKKKWIDDISGRKVDVEDFDEVLELLQGV